MITESRLWQPGDEVILHLPMTPRFIYPDPRIDAVRGCVAVERGPLVMALESVDVPEAASVDELRLDVSQPPREVDGQVVVRCHSLAARDHDWPYSAHGNERGPDQAIKTADIPLVPYHAWANRGSSTMRVWLPVDAPHV